MRFEIPYSEVMRRLYALTALDRADNMMVERGEKPFVISPDNLPAIEALLGGTAAALIVRLPGVIAASVADPVAFEALCLATPSTVLELATEAMAYDVLAHVYRNDSPKSAAQYRASADEAVMALQQLLSPDGGLPVVKAHDL